MSYILLKGKEEDYVFLYVVQLRLLLMCRYRDMMPQNQCGRKLQHLAEVDHLVYSNGMKQSGVF